MCIVFWSLVDQSKLWWTLKNRLVKWKLTNCVRVCRSGLISANTAAFPKPRSKSVASTLPNLLPVTVSQTTFIISLTLISSNSASKPNYSRQQHIVANFSQPSRTFCKWQCRNSAIVLCCIVCVCVTLCVYVWSAAGDCESMHHSTYTDSAHPVPANQMWVVLPQLSSYF